ncbi:MAG: hypothetical protein Q8P67_27110 [archaeon]|nr:hypothetical protein [archaeon]
MASHSTPQYSIRKHTQHSRTASPPQHRQPLFPPLPSLPLAISNSTWLAQGPVLSLSSHAAASSSASLSFPSFPSFQVPPKFSDRSLLSI